IAKSDGKLRPLGIPTVADRVAQMVVKMTLEPEWDHKFHSSSFGYRPKRSAHHAVQAAKINCWKYSWVIDLDIKGFFDNLNHDHYNNLLRKRQITHGATSISSVGSLPVCKCQAVNFNKQKKE